LAADGDLLLYDKSGKVSGVVSNTEKALRAVLKSSSFELTDEDIRKDLLREKDNDFVQTLTYSALRSTYGQVTGMRPAFAVVPKIALSSPKIRSKMTTRVFAESVDRRYQSCMARK
jgi:ATP-dependent exoDNAse (exonuclease V) beta subunit